MRNPQCSQTLQFYKNLRHKWFLSDFLNCLAQVDDQSIRTFTFITDVLVAFTADSTGLCITIIKSYATTRASFPQVAVPMFTQRGATCVRHSTSLRRSQSRCSKPKHNSRSCQGRSEEEVAGGGARNPGCLSPSDGKTSEVPRPPGRCQKTRVPQGLTGRILTEEMPWNAVQDSTGTECSWPVDLFHGEGMADALSLL